MRSLTTRLRLEALDARDLPSATPLDLTAAGSSGTINGAIFRQDDQPTDQFNPFVRLQANANCGVQQGYNTDARPLQFDEKRDATFTHSLRLGDVPQAVIGGQTYRVFVLDVNQGESRPCVSLDRLQIFTAGHGSLGHYAAGTLFGGALAYDLDANVDSFVKLDARLNTGGYGDMLLYVPESAFAGAGADAYVYLYSRFGETIAGKGGFRQWGVGPATPPPPVLTGTISGTVIDPFNFSAGVAGVAVYVDANGNGLYDAGELTARTDADGVFTFTNLPADGGPSVYSIRMDLTDAPWTSIGEEWIVVALNPGDAVTVRGFAVTAP